MNPMNLAEDEQHKIFSFCCAKVSLLSCRVCVRCASSHDFCGCGKIESKMATTGTDKIEKNKKQAKQVSAWWTYHSSDFQSPRAWASNFRNHITGARLATQGPGSQFSEPFGSARKKFAALETGCSFQVPSISLYFHVCSRWYVPSERANPSKKMTFTFISSTFGLKELHFGGTQNQPWVLQHIFYSISLSNPYTWDGDRPGWSGEAKTLEGLLSKVLVEVLVGLGQELCRGL